jgi:hypothetical protein
VSEDGRHGSMSGPVRLPCLRRPSRSTSVLPFACTPHHGRNTLASGPRRRRSQHQPHPARSTTTPFLPPATGPTSCSDPRASCIASAAKTSRTQNFFTYPASLLLPALRTFVSRLHAVAASSIGEKTASVRQRRHMYRQGF